MRIPDGVLEEIQNRVDIVDVVGDYVHLERRGSRFMGLCPFHNEKTPSFSVNPEKNLFYCFGCHKGGTMFTFLMEIEHITFLEAARKLAERAGIELNSDDISEESQSRRTQLEVLYKRISGSFHYFLTEHEKGAPARNYLRERGIREDMIKTFQIGYAPEDRRWLYRFLRGKNYSEEFLAASGMFSRKYPEVSIFSGRVIFPIYTPGGNVAAFGGRSIDGRDPKYINSPETEIFQKRKSLFGLYQSIKGIRETGTVHVVEGYFDVVALFQAGIPEAVAPLGTALTEEQGRMLRRYTDKAVLIFDDDPAGLKAVWRGLEIMEKCGINSTVVVPSGGKDPADILQNEGSNSLHNMLKSASNGFSFLLGKAVEQHGLADAKAKRKVLEALAPYLSTVESELVREDHLKTLADTMNAGIEAVKSDFSALLQGKKTRTEGQIATEAKKKSIGSDLFLMLVVAVNCGYFLKVRQFVSIEQLQDPMARELYIALEEAYRQDELDIDHVIPRIESVDLQGLIVEKSTTGEFEVNVEDLVRDGIRNIQIRALKKKRDEVTEQLKSASIEGSHREALKELLSEKMYLDEELNRMKGDAQ
jgi:DNA primase